MEACGRSHGCWGHRRRKTTLLFYRALGRYGDHAGRGEEETSGGEMASYGSQRSAHYRFCSFICSPLLSSLDDKDIQDRLSRRGHVISTEGHAIFLRSARETITIRAATIFRLICFLFLCTFSLCAGIVKTFGRIALGSAGLHARVSETSLFRARTRELFDPDIIAINSF